MQNGESRRDVGMQEAELIKFQLAIGLWRRVVSGSILNRRCNAACLKKRRLNEEERSENSVEGSLD